MEQNPNVSFRLGDQLLRKGRVTQVQIDYALQKQKVEGDYLGQILVAQGLITGEDLAAHLANHRNIPYLGMQSILPKPDAEVLKLFSRELCLARAFLPIRREGDCLDVVVGNGDLAEIAEVVLRRSGLQCCFTQTEFRRLAEWTRHVYYFSHNPVEELIDKELALLAQDIDRTRGPERLLEYLLHHAVRERSSDIHIDASAGSYHVLYRVDGVLRPVFAMPLTLQRLITYIKLTADMDISEQRRPQDGSFQVQVLELPYTVRISTLITDHGERLVLRLLPEQADLARLEQLGFREQDIALLRNLFARPSGMVLVTGPTGSGKSTTLHAALRLQALIERNVLTVEDPIEYRLPTVCQTEVNRRSGYEFGTALRHFLRHDPDVILVGEIRDKETAEAAVTASATGHLVLSTLHVGSVFGVLPRLIPMGLEPATLGENLLAVINQRLVRKVCPHCAESYPVSEEMQAWLGDELAVGAQLKKGAGCERCSGSGYLGRLPVYEILSIDTALANAIAEDGTRKQLQQLALENGFESMLAQAKWRVAQGDTTFAEVRRVVGEVEL